MSDPRRSILGMPIAHPSDSVIGSSWQDTEATRRLLGLESESKGEPIDLDGGKLYSNSASSTSSSTSSSSDSSSSQDEVRLSFNQIDSDSDNEGDPQVGLDPLSNEQKIAASNLSSTPLGRKVRANQAENETKALEDLKARRTPTVVNKIFSGGKQVIDGLVPTFIFPPSPILSSMIIDANNTFGGLIGTPLFSDYPLDEFRGQDGTQSVCKGLGKKTVQVLGRNAVPAIIAFGISQSEKGSTEGLIWSCVVPVGYYALNRLVNAGFEYTETFKSPILDPRKTDPNRWAVTRGVQSVFRNGLEFMGSFMTAEALKIVLKEGNMRIPYVPTELLPVLTSVVNNVIATLADPEGMPSLVPQSEYKGNETSNYQIAKSVGWKAVITVGAVTVAYYANQAMQTVTGEISEEDNLIQKAAKTALPFFAAKVVNKAASYVYSSLYNSGCSLFCKKSQPSSALKDPLLEENNSNSAEFKA